MSLSRSLEPRGIMINLRKLRQISNDEMKSKGLRLRFTDVLRDQTNLVTSNQNGKFACDAVLSKRSLAGPIGVYLKNVEM
jgi:hypothetical protein